VLIEESIAKSNQGSIKLDEVAAAILGVTESSGKVKTLVDEVNVGSQEQARGIEQIAKAFSQMEQVIQKTAAGAEESASAGEELNAQADTLRGLVAELATIVQQSSARERQAEIRPAEARPTGPVNKPLSAPAGFQWAPVRPAHQPEPNAAAAFPLDDDFTQF
jgi:methyl-accepting chemotaxis protein/methyl-accepting chemotaxis protein-1 (serine sensor receptor)